jgi:hypothetical protein
VLWLIASTDTEKTLNTAETLSETFHSLCTESSTMLHRAAPKRQSSIRQKASHQTLEIPDTLVEASLPRRSLRIQRKPSEVSTEVICQQPPSSPGASRTRKRKNESLIQEHVNSKQKASSKRTAL